MLIGLCGGICAGKRTIAKYLEEHHSFTPLYLQQEIIADETVASAPNGIKKQEGDDEGGKASIRTVPQYNSSTYSSSGVHTFDNTEDLIDFVTKRWRERWVTTDIHTESILDKLLRRPFFILVS